LARDLELAYSEQQVAAGQTAWRTPAIFFWQDWLARQLTLAQDPVVLPRRLDLFSSSILWEHCLQRRMPDGLLSFGGIVRQAGQAWQRICEWNLSLPMLLSAASSQDERLFARAAADYRERLDDGNWIDSAGMPNQVAKLINDHAGVMPSRVVFAGFDRLTPAVEGVIEALRARACEVEVHSAPDRHATAMVATFDDETAEMRAAGAWARDFLQKQPDAQVAIVCQGLESRAADISRLVREGLAPGWQFGGPQYRAAVNVSYGRRLSDYPAIAMALLVLRWVCQGLSSRELSMLLRSRCVASDQVAGRSRLELLLRSHPDREWSPSAILNFARSIEEAADTRAFVSLVQSIAELSSSASKQASPAECVGRVDALLKSMQWPGETSLDSDEFQLVNRWRELLNEFARVESVAPQISLAEAIQRLTGLAKDAVWQPENGRGMVQVLGTLEAAGMEFDGLWVSGLDAAQWPPSSRPSPFISLALQRDKEMPDATPADTLEFSKRVLSRLVGAADQCVLSWSRIREDSELTASTLLDDFDTVTYEGPVDPGWYALGLTGSHHTISHNDDQVPPVATDEHVGGGAYTVQRHFTEPFSAFASGRLGIRVPDPISTGLSASMRGNIIHNALHNLLSGKPSQQVIGNWTADEIARRIGSAVDAALAAHIANADLVLRRIIGIERGRLIQLLRDFIREEAKRPEFSVADIERKADYEMFGIRLGLRIDRIDRLADGRLLVIDYKTGSPKTFLNKDRELKDLQLVLYADALGDDIGGLAFINIDAREIGYKGAGGGWNEAEEEGWDDTLRSWRAVVHATLESLAAGDARINVLQSASEGRSLNILSRLEEQKRA
jgi:probable DNA repair protein